MADRIRTYTFKVTCPLPSSRNGEPRSMTSYVYGATTVTNAKDRWFLERLPYARKHGVRGSTENLRKKLSLHIERIALSQDERLASLTK